MKPERWQQLNQLFYAALERGPHERVAFLEQACAGDDELRKQVEALLVAYEQSGSFIEHPALEVEAQLIADEEQRSSGDSIGYGETIDHYRIIERLGSGGMGDVYLAQDLKLGRRVALKLLPQRFTEDAERLRRFEQEARAASALNHPNILTIYEIGNAGSTRYIATEFVDGTTLRAYIAGKPLKNDETISLTIQIGNALAAAHAKGIIHRDIKPENIMLSRGVHPTRTIGNVKVLDFGIAKLADADVLQTDMPTRPIIRTSEGIAMGTTPYMSPEQLRGEAVDTRTDIWSLGIVLYEMLAGTLPFDGNTSADLRAAILRDEWSPLPSEVPDALKSIVKNALRKDRMERYQNIGEMLIDLQRLQSRTVNTLQAAVARPTSSLEYISEIRRHKRGQAIVIGLLVLGVVGSAIWIKKFSWSNPKAFGVSFQSAKIMRLTTSGKVIDAAISPDGKYVAHIVDDGGQQSLWVRQVATQSNVEIIPPTEADYGGLTFSPDGNYIYYVVATKSAPAGALFQVPSVGGVSGKVLTDIQSPVSFSRDGKRFAYLNYSFKDAEDVLMIANVDGTGVRRLAGRRGNEQFYRGPGSAISWSPDGKTIASPAGNSSPENYMTVVTVSVESGEINFFTPQKWRGIKQVAWLPDGKGILVIAWDTGFFHYQIWEVAYPKGTARPITNDLSNYFTLSLDANSDALITVQAETVANIWIAPANDSGDAKEITSGRHFDSDPAWMSDNTLLYDSDEGGSPDLYATNTQDGNARRFSTSPNFNQQVLLWPSVSPDGRYIAFASVTSDNPHIWRMDLDGSNPLKLTEEYASHPQWSPDSQWIFYVSYEDNATAIRKIAASGGQSARLIKDGWGLFPTVSPDGKQFACYYLAAQKSPPKLIVLPIGDGQPKKTLTTQPSFRSTIALLNGVIMQASLRWTPDGRAVVYVLTHSGVSNLWAQPVDGGAPEQLTKFTRDLIFAFDYSRDGKQIALSRGTQTSDVVLINNFKE